MLRSPGRARTRTTAAACQPALSGPLPGRDVTHAVQAPGRHGSVPSPREGAGPRPAWGPDRSSLRRPLIVLAAGAFAIGTDAFVIGGVLPAVARSLGVSTGSAGLLVTAFAIAYAIGGPILAVGTAPRPRPAPMGAGLALFAAANIPPSRV